MSEREPVLAVEGPAAPPRANGELVFDAPWQSRIFGLTLALHEAGRFEWPEFQARLIAAIGAHERELRAAFRPDGQAEESGFDTEGYDTEGYDYYGCWLEALRALAQEKGWLAAEALRSLEHDLLERPAGHDHGDH